VGVLNSGLGVQWGVCGEAVGRQKNSPPNSPKGDNRDPKLPTASPLKRALLGLKERERLLEGVF
jgi:hypothetical protein